MEFKEKLELLEEMMELDEGSINETTLLADIEEWDSIAALSLIVLLDEKFEKAITGNQIKELKIVSDILEFMV